MSTKAGSSRWCPTPEQLMNLEEMYRSGIRTLTASQIQHLTAHLSLYGKIEGKNVYYWFQNHKARDRQKLRRKLSKQLQLQKQHHQQLMNHNDQQTHHFHGGFGSVPSSFYNSSSLLVFSQGEAEDASKQAENYIWKVHNQQRVMENQKTPITFYNCDWKMMMDMSPANSLCCNTRPLKTLELFPVTEAGLKEDCTKSN